MTETLVEIFVFVIRILVSVIIGFVLLYAAANVFPFSKNGKDMSIMMRALKLVTFLLICYTIGSMVLSSIGINVVKN